MSDVVLFLGCAFLTFCSREAALNAQKDLHEKKTLPGVGSSFRYDYPKLVH